MPPRSSRSFAGLLGPSLLCAFALDATSAQATQAAPSVWAPSIVAAPTVSLRPTGRPLGEGSVIHSSLRPQSRPDGTQGVPDASLAAGFRSWLVAFRSRARAAGIASQVLDQALSDLTFDPDIIRNDGNQSEFVTPIWTYLDRAVSADRIATGQAALRDYNATLQRIEATYGVDKEVVVAVWGMESNFGSFRGNREVIRSLATLAFEGRRAEFFESQLIAALRILQAGDVRPEDMTGSWAGAMGHTQFMPTSYLDYAVDFTGDGRRDIWSDDPTDALASTAAYLQKFGWEKDRPWGLEVRVPAGFDYALAERTQIKSAREWRRLGLTTALGNRLPNHGKAALLLPAGANGPAFLVYKNFAVIERYNAADAYVIGVGHLSDRIKGAGPFAGDWPLGSRPLTRSERKELQQRLSSSGFDTGGIDGRVGPRTRAAVRAFQLASGLIPDGYPSHAVLERLR
ncbi:lytic murein transglycosylase [Phaeobacter sp.]|uniref:lytic murein transglycosylase n=1 Tax=Phaeobacter sp. TaxID=1902409 RepID=UPI0025CCE524|nr:lytic murein transglycosylase [Phaeobacter sp.]